VAAWCAVCYEKVFFFFTKNQKKLKKKNKHKKKKILEEKRKISQTFQKRHKCESPYLSYLIFEY